MLENADTIAAISTAFGQAAISIIRISGKNAKIIITQIFGSNKANIEHGKSVLGWIIDPKTKKKIDEVLVISFDGPKSFTGEDLIEIHCHGGIAIQKIILGLVLENGARLAEKGEFTKRGFLNGKFDLIQAESIIEMINGKTEKSVAESAKRLDGKLSKQIQNFKTKLLNILSQIEASIDFPDDVDEPEKHTLLQDVLSLKNQMNILLKTEKEGIALNEGITIAIVGKPNVGKSSLLNTLLKKDRAIVTDIPGTTTDTIEEIISINGVPFKIIDTAGIRQTTNSIEKEGLKRTTEAIEGVDIIIAMFDMSSKLDDCDEAVIKAISNKPNIIVLLNKCDLGHIMDENALTGLGEPLRASVKNSKGLELLERKLLALASVSDIASDDIIISNVRQANCLRLAVKHLEQAEKAIGEALPIDLISIDFNEAIQNVASLSGDAVSEEVINNIFTNFCVGK